MTRKEYKSAKESIDAQIKALNDQADKMEGEFIDEHCPYNGGDRVKIIVKPTWGDKEEEHIGIVKNCRVSSSGELVYYFAKAKKDGTESNYRLTIWGKIKSIELIEKAK